MSKTPGTGTPAKQLKRLWRKARSGLSLKTFAKALVKEGHELATDTTRWVSSKLGKLKDKCSSAKSAHKKLLASATKATKSKKK